MKQRHYFLRQSGVTLVELMVGIAIGLLVIAVAMGAMMASRNISGAVSDVTTLQQQAANAFRIIGQQIRQAGSLELSLNPGIAGIDTGDADYSMLPVAFDPPDPTAEDDTPFDRVADTLSGTDTPVSLTTGYQNYTETTTESSSTPKSLLRDCLGQNTDPSIISSQFKFESDKKRITCNGQPIIGDEREDANTFKVTDFKIRYIKQSSGKVDMQYITTAASINGSDWNNVYAVEVCMELTGAEKAVVPEGATYKNCNAENSPYGDRLRMVFHNTYQIRSQSGG